MPVRGRSHPVGARGRAAFSLDVVLLAPSGDELAVLLRRGGEGARARWTLPYEVPAPDDPLRGSALKLARAVAGAEPAWFEQVGAFGDSRRHPSECPLSVVFVGVLPSEATVLADAETANWVVASDLPPLAPRQKEMAREGMETVRVRLDYAPIAFRLLPPVFTLSDLQQMYELLLGRRLHKASFRRSLQAAALVEPIDEWRSEGRGRPAQLFRYAPRKRRKDRRGVRFELLGG